MNAFYYVLLDGISQSLFQFHVEVATQI